MLKQYFDIAFYIGENILYILCAFFITCHFAYSCWKNSKPYIGTFFNIQFNIKYAESIMMVVLCDMRCSL